MKLRTDQLEVLTGVAMAEFELRLMAHWRECFPGRVREIDEERLPILARAAVIEARDKGITSELGIATYVDLCLALGTGFATRG
jgi:hypothetical protein